MKYLSFIAAAVLFTLQADIAHSQVVSDSFESYQYSDRSESIEWQWRDIPHRNNSQFIALGLALDSDGAVGGSVFGGEWMLDIMTTTDYDEDVFKLKLGRSFMVSGDRDFNFNLYAMGGYSSQDGESDLMLEGGPMIFFAVGESFDVALGAGYNYDMAIEETYYTFRGYFFLF